MTFLDWLNDNWGLIAIAILATVGAVETLLRLWGRVFKSDGMIRASRRIHAIARRGLQLFGIIKRAEGMKDEMEVAKMALIDIRERGEACCQFHDDLCGCAIWSGDLANKALTLIAAYESREKDETHKS